MVVTGALTKGEFVMYLNECLFPHVRSYAGYLQVQGPGPLQSMNTCPAGKVLYSCKSCLRQKVGEAAEYFTNQKQGGCLYIW